MNFQIIFITVCVLCLSCPGIVSGRAASSRRSIRPTSLVHYISFLNKEGKSCANERVIVTDTEARFDVEDKMSYVFDYEKKQLVFRETTTGAPCYLYTGFDISVIPTIDELRQMLTENKVFKLPLEKYELSLQKSHVQPLMRPQLLPVAEKLCQNSQVVLLEPKTIANEGTNALAQTRVIRPKREVGWGEVVVIIIVIIILL